MGISVIGAAASSSGGTNNFVLETTAETTYVLDRTYTSGRYSLSFLDSDTTFDIYAIAEDGTYAGYTASTILEASANFAEVVVLGAASGTRISFTHLGVITESVTSGDVATAGAFVSSVVTSSLPSVDDTTVVNGGNFAADVEVSFIDQSSVETAAKTVVRSSSTQLLITRPDSFSPDDSPFTIKVANPGIPVPSGSNAHLLSNSVTAGTNPVWTTGTTVVYNVGGATSVTLLATDTEATDIDYSVVSGTLPAGLTLDGETGVISGTASGTPAEGDVTAVTIRAIDAGGNFLDKAFDFTANVAPTWTTAAGAIDPAPSPDTAYSFQLVASTGSAGGALTYTLQSGALLAGHSLSTVGVISGTSTGVTDDIATFTVRVTDEGGLFADRSFTTTIGAAAGPFMATLTTALASGTMIGTAVATTEAGATYVGSYSSGSPAGNSYDFLIARVDGTGALEWQRQIGGTSNEFLRGMASDSDENVYAFGDSQSGPDQGLIVKYNSSGVLQWQRTIGSNNDTKLTRGVCDSAGNIYVTGYTQDFGQGSNDALLIKFSSAGAILWQKTFGATSSDIGTNVAVDSSDNVYLTGYQSSVGPATNPFVAKWNSSGSLQWQRVGTLSTQSEPSYIKVSSAGDIYISGYISSGVGAGSNDVFLIKFNSSADVQWARTCGSAASEQGYGLAIDESNNVYITTQTTTGSQGASDTVIVKYDSSGAVVWQRMFGTENNDLVRDLTVQGDFLRSVGYRNNGSSNELLLASLPIDGSKMGAYRLGTVDMIYGEGPLTSTAYTYTQQTSGLTEGTPTYSPTASSLTSYTSTDTYTVTEGSPYGVWSNPADVTPAEVGVAYSKLFAVAVESMSTTVAYSLISGSVPAGMSFNASTGVLSGTSTESAGTIRTFELRGVTSTGVTVDKTFSLPTVMAPRFSSSATEFEVLNIAPYTDQYYVFYNNGSANVTSLTNNNNCVKLMVGGGASGSYGGGYGNGGDGASVHYSAGHSFTTNEVNSLVVGAGGQTSFNYNNYPGGYTEFDGDQAGGGNGAANGDAGSNAGSAIMTVIYDHLREWNPNPNTNYWDTPYRGLDTGYLGGSGSSMTSGGSPNLPGLGGGGIGLSGISSATYGLYLTGGGGGGGGVSGYGSSAGLGGGQGMMVIKVPNQT
jgi:hypothetical protein